MTTPTSREASVGEVAQDSRWQKALIALRLGCIRSEGLKADTGEVAPATAQKELQQE